MGQKDFSNTLKTMKHEYIQSHQKSDFHSTHECSSIYIFIAKFFGCFAVSSDYSYVNHFVLNLPIEVLYYIIFIKLYALLLKDHET